MIIINSNTRQFNVPGADLVFGVSGDSGSEVKRFQCPRYVGNNLDLMSCFVRINFRNGNGKMDSYLVDDMAIDGDNITFSWVLSPKVTEYRGQVKFVMCAVGPDLKLKWHTTQGTGQVMEGLEPDNSHAESQTADVVAQLIAMVEAQTSTVEKVGAEQVAVIKSATETHRTAAVNEIEAKRVNSLASIPNDYTILSSTVESLVRERASGIVCSAEGEVITLNDASNQAFRGMRIFGKSTQYGTPTPENPVEIVSIGGKGSILATVCCKNLLQFAIAGKTYTNSGITVVFDRDGCVANGTPTKDYVIVDTVANMFLPAGTYYISGGVNGKFYAQVIITKNGVKYYYIDKAFTIDGTETRVEVSLQTGPASSVGTLNGYRIYPMLVVGSVAPVKYESYKGQTLDVSTPNGLPGIPVTSGGNYTDENGQQWICDEVDFERGVYVQRVIEKAYESGERWQFVKATNGFYRYYLKVSDVIATGVTIMSRVVSSALPTISVTEWDAVTNACIGLHPTDKTINVFVPFATAEEWEAYLGTNKMTVIYQFATPIETPLSESELAAYRALHTNKPNTTILNDSGAYMSVDYTADTKLYIDNKIKEALL